VLEHYLPIVIYFTIALVVALGVMGASRMLGPRKPSTNKLMPYECGIVPEAEVGPRFSVKFYLVAMLFMIFDVEAVSFYPWAVEMHALKVFGLVEMVLFIVVLAIGYAYIWRRGGFQWDR
jgi:NADH-quinone oxidoreductase subunit A